MSSNYFNDSGNFTFEKIDLDVDASDVDLPASIRTNDLDMDALLHELENSAGQLGSIGGSIMTDDDGGGLLDLGDGDDDNAHVALLGRLSSHKVHDDDNYQQRQEAQHYQKQEDWPPELASVENLLTMDLIEVDDDKLRNELTEELGLPLPASSNYQPRQQLLPHQQQQEQRYVPEATHSSVPQMMAVPMNLSSNNNSNINKSLSGPGTTAADNLVQLGSDDLEREKNNLLRQLEEIKRKKQQNQLQQSQLQQRVATTVAVSRPGETPLQSFLRGANKGGTSISQTNNGVSVVNMGPQTVTNATPVATIFDAAPMDVGFGGGSNPLLFQQRSSMDTDVNMDQMGYSNQSSNAVWGTNPGLSRTSHMTLSGRHRMAQSSRMPHKHASESILMHAAGSGLSKSKNRLGSLSRENGLYELLRNKKGSKTNLTSLNRHGAQKSLSRQGSRTGLSREGSFGSLFPVKRVGTGTTSKYKIGGIGASVSVPHMKINSSLYRSTSPYGQGGGSGQQNAIW